jgi:hypothetical protein
MPKRWYSMTVRARCEMTVWVEASSAKEARQLYDLTEYDEMSPWEPIGPGRVGRPRLAPNFEPQNDNP